MKYDYKSGVKKAIENFSMKSLPKKKRAKRTNPELEFQNDLMDHMIAQGFDPISVDSSTFGVYHQRKVSETGVSDIVANYGSLSVWVECKSVKSRTNLSYQQYQFLKRKCLVGCFAVCVSTTKEFDDLWSFYKSGGQMVDRLPMSAEVKRGIEDDNTPLKFD